MPKQPSAARGPGKREVRKLLASLSKEGLIDEMMRMYDDFTPVREYLSMRVSPDDTAVREKYKRIVAKEFSSSSYRAPRISVARKAVLDYRKVAASDEGIADVMLYYVERAVAFMDDVGGDDALISSAWSLYQDAVVHIVKHRLEERFRERSRRLARRDVGHGFSEMVMDLHTAWFEDGGDLDEEDEADNDE